MAVLLPLGVHQESFLGGENYKNVLDLYEEYPQDDVRLELFEQLATARFSLLKKIEAVRVQSRKNFDDYDDKIKLIIMEFEKRLTSFIPDQIREENKRISINKYDKLSHFILRIPFCTTAEQRSWFLAQETAIFRFRFQQESFESKRNYMLSHVSNYKTVSVKDLAADEFAYGWEPDGDYQNFVYEVNFLDVLDLVKSRQVLLKNGKAYVPLKDSFSLACNSFRCNLSLELTKLSYNLPSLLHDPRIALLVENLASSCSGNEALNLGGKSSDETISLSELEMASKVSFPLCMSMLHDHLMQNHHLKHHGRLQYGLFLKTIGLTLEESLAFWRSAFSKKMDNHKFEKTYSYNIRYNYGIEGKRKDPRSYSCVKIITSNPPGPTDCHGCPFRHLKRQELISACKKKGVDAESLQEILKLVDENHYQIACGKYFTSVHKVETDATINHPSDYFQLSRRVLTSQNRN